MLSDDLDGLAADPELQEEFAEFCRMMEQTTDFYQKATAFLAAARIRELSDMPSRSRRRRRGLLWAFSRIRRFSPRWRVPKEKAWQPTITIIDVTPVDPERKYWKRSTRSNGSPSERRESNE